VARGPCHEATFVSTSSFHFAVKLIYIESHSGANVATAPTREVRYGTSGGFHAGRC
jgi:hypothetical protein